MLIFKKLDQIIKEFENISKEEILSKAHEQYLAILEEMTGATTDLIPRLQGSLSMAESILNIPENKKVKEEMEKVQKQHQEESEEIGN